MSGCRLLLFAVLAASSRLPAQYAWNLRNPTPTLAQLSSTAAGNGVFVAVGANGTVLSSPDTVTWTQRDLGTTEAVARVTFAGGQFVASGNSGAQFFSTDGVSWFQRTGGYGGNAGSRIAYGNGTFVSLVPKSYTLLTATSVLAWTELTFGTSMPFGAPTNLNAIAFGNGVFVIGSQRGLLYTSTDGYIWTRTQTSFGTTDSATITDLAFGNGVFLARLQSGLIARSTDGATWTLLAGSYLGGLRFAGDRFFLRTNGNVLATSTDGLTFTPQPGAPSDLVTATISAGGGLFLGTNGTRLYASSNATTWTMVGQSLPLADVGLAFGLGKFLAANGYVSADGVTWSPGGFAIDTHVYGSYSVCFAHDRFFILNPTTVYLNGLTSGVAGDRIWSSTDGVTGSLVSTVTGTMNRLVYGNGHYLGSGSNYDGTLLFFSSTDGVAWTSYPGSASLFLSQVSDLIFDGTQFLAVTPRGAIFTSPDGATWTQRQADTSDAGNALYAIAKGPGGYLAVGFDQSYTSTDSLTWTPIPAPTQAFSTTAPLLNINGQWVAATSNLLLTSADGSTWTQFVSPSRSAIHGLAAGNGHLVAISADSTALESALVPAPVITTSLSPTTVDGAGGTLTLTAAATSASPLSYQWTYNGVNIFGATGPTLTVNNVTTDQTGTYTLKISDGTSTVVTSTSVQIYASLLPTVYSSYPQYYITVNSDSGAFSLTFYGFATGPGPLSYQWRRNGVAFQTGTSTTATLPNASAGDFAATYDFVVSNAYGSTTSTSLKITGDAPRISSFSGPRAIYPGNVGFFNVSVAGTGPFSYTWRRNGTVIPGLGKTSPFISTNSDPSLATGYFDVVVSSPFGSATSGLQPLQVLYSRLINLSVLAYAGTGLESLTAGLVSDGTYNVSQSLLIRAIGPGLGSFGVTGFLANPYLSLRDSSGTVLKEDDQWSDIQPDLTPTFNLVGAFPLPAGSNDAALLSLITGNASAQAFTAEVSGRPSGTGESLLELYDTSKGLQRIVNLSARASVGPGRTFTAGFVIEGTRPLRVLIRGVGPTLAGLGLTGALANPKLTLYNAAGQAIGNNDTWGQAANVADIRTFSGFAGAFALTEGGNDAAMLVTLDPGAYTAQVTSVDGTTGVALVEIYEIP